MLARIYLVASEFPDRWPSECPHLSVFLCATRTCRVQIRYPSNLMLNPCDLRQGFSDWWTELSTFVQLYAVFAAEHDPD